MPAKAPNPQSLHQLEQTRQHLKALPAAHLATLWAETLAELQGDAALHERMAAALAFSPAALAAALKVVLAGVSGPDELALFDAPPSKAPGPLLVFLAATPPGLAAQVVLPALALRRPLLLKVASAEPHFAPHLLERLAAREPLLGEALACASWRGGDREIEDPLLAAAGRVVAYGGGDTMASLAARCPSPFFGFGPKISLAIVGPEADPEPVAAGLARDIALLDQRGCLSVQAVLVAGGGEMALAEALTGALANITTELPPGPVDPATLAAWRLAREEAELRAARVLPLPLRQGTVIVEKPGTPLKPSPGGRSVRIYPIAALTDALEILRPWQGWLQGIALEASAENLAAELTALGVTRIAPPGQLQKADLAGWSNGGRSVLEVFGM